MIDEEIYSKNSVCYYSTPYVQFLLIIGIEIRYPMSIILCPITIILLINHNIETTSSLVREKSIIQIVVSKTSVHLAFTKVQPPISIILSQTINSKCPVQLILLFFKYLDTAYWLTSWFRDSIRNIHLFWTWAIFYSRLIEPLFIWI